MPEKILIVDDDIDTLKLVGLILQRQGYEVTVASSGSQALEMMKTEVPDLLLLDIMMPEIDGYEVAVQMRSEPMLAEVPIIMFTAKSQLDDKVAGFEAGADDYLTKPTQPRELLAHIKAVLARSSK
ncbi:MAG: response regulator transcription factor, partial [Anaerolineales bacterium]